MKQLRFAILTLTVIVSLGATAQEERTDTVIPKFLSNGYFFREMPTLPDGNKMMMRLKDKEGNSIIVINTDADLPQSLISQAIPREQVHNADQFLNGVNTMNNMQELTQANVKPDGTYYSPVVGEPFPAFAETDMEGRTWTNADVQGKVMVLNLWFSGCGPCRAEMPTLSEWKEMLPDVMFFSATFHDSETAKKITDKHHFTWTHLVNAKGMMAWIGTKGFPLTIVVDKQGIVRYAVHGTSEEKRAELLAMIKKVDAE